MTKQLNNLDDLFKAEGIDPGKTKKVTAAKIDALIRKAVFGDDKEKYCALVRELAGRLGIFPMSIQGLYDAAGKGLYGKVTVPAINIRGITYDTARAVFRAAMKTNAGAFIFEIARSEIGYTEQRPAEYSACILAAAIREGFKGPVFIQGDHFQVNRAEYASEPEKELEAIRSLIKEAVAAGFYNIDIDASTVVDIDKVNLDEQQAKNCIVTAEMTDFIRSIEPENITISIGGEIGEVGKKNSTVADFKSFMKGYQKQLGKAEKGISKISVQTGTSHGGVVLPDGSIARVQLDFKALEAISKSAREDFGMGGAVQHGASTLPDDAFNFFPEVGCVEVHLATGFQNMVYESPNFPGELTEKIHRYISEKYAPERKSGQTDSQFFYENRKRTFGPFKKEMWDIPEKDLKAIRAALEERFIFLFRKLNITDSSSLIGKYVCSSEFSC